MTIACGTSSPSAAGSAQDALAAPGTGSDAAVGADTSTPTPGADSSTPTPVADGSTPAADGGYPAGWLYTDGGKIYVSDGATGTQWMGRGVNVDDIFFCGYDRTLYDDVARSDARDGCLRADERMEAELRPHLAGMDSYTTVVSWLGDALAVQDADDERHQRHGAKPGVYVLVTLRSDASMIGQDETDGDPEATGLPPTQRRRRTRRSIPTGTDATYVALVDTFATRASSSSAHQRAGRRQALERDPRRGHEPCGRRIRAEEDRLRRAASHRLGPGQRLDERHQLLRDDAARLRQRRLRNPRVPADDGVLHVPEHPRHHRRVRDPERLDEFYADLEAKQIPNLAWDFDSYSNCAPDLLTVNQSATNLMPTAWGTTVQTYLLAH